MDRIQQIAAIDIMRRINVMDHIVYIKDPKNLPILNKWLPISKKLMAFTTYRDTITPGLVYYGTSLKDCDDDINTTEVFLANTSATVEFKMNVPAPPVDSALQTVSVCHDLLDAMMYELKGINSHSGKLHGMNFEATRDLLRMRLRSLGRYLSRKSGYASDYAIIEGLEGAIYSGVEAAKTLFDLLVISDTISVSMPRLILFRRHWSL